MFGSAGATDYAGDVNNPCRLMRNVAPGVPLQPEPNRDDTQAAMQLGGAPKSIVDHEPMFRKRFAQAFVLLHKIDGDGTTALTQLPPDTLRLDLVIGRHVGNLQWARTMLGTFYEEGRASPIDYEQAAAFYQKAVDTRFVDDHGCVYDGWVDVRTVTHLAGYYAYGAGVPRDPAKARKLLQRAGASGKPILTLLDHDAMPRDIGAYFNLLANPSGLKDEASAAEHPRSASDPPNLMAWIAFPDAAMATITSPFETAATWASAIAAVLVAAFAGLWLLHWRRARLEQRSSIYRTAFAVYDVIQKIMGRIGLFASGVIACGAGVFIVLQASIFGFVGPIRLLILLMGGTALVGGIIKLVEAVRFSHTPKDTLVHGAARPAGEKEAQAAARGDPGASPLRDQTFKD